MTRRIDADALAKKFERNVYADFYSGEFIRKAIEEATTDEEEIVQHGFWSDMGARQLWWKCSICGEIADKSTRFCPNCGAKMDKGGIR